MKVRNHEMIKYKMRAKTMIEGYRTYYSFIRLHRSPNGKTFAEMTNVD